VIRLYVVVEGQTEESFIKNIVAEVLWQKSVHPEPIILGTSGHRGGRTSYARVKRDVLKLLKQQRTAYCSTMIDLYGLGPGFPGIPVPAGLTNIAKVRHLERAFKDDICAGFPELRPDIRLVPYFQLHEYEGLLFSDPAAFANGINQSHLGHRFQRIREGFNSPEDINDSPESAPSKRVLAEFRSYNKVIDGTRAASSVGIAAMREQCRHFREWLETLEMLAELQPR
jgi:hypothetical protein